MRSPSATLLLNLNLPLCLCTTSSNAKLLYRHACSIAPSIGPSSGEHMFTCIMKSHISCAISSRSLSSSRSRCRASYSSSVLDSDEEYQTSERSDICRDTGTDIGGKQERTPSARRAVAAPRGQIRSEGRVGGTRRIVIALCWEIAAVGHGTLV